MRELIERLEEARIGVDAVAIDDDIIDAAREYLKSEASTLGRLMSGISKHVKKKTGKPIGVKIIAPLLGKFMTREGF